MIKRSTWIMLGFFVLLLAVTLWLQRSNEADPAETVPTVPSLKLVFDFPMTDIAQLRVENLDGAVVEVVRTDFGWALSAPETAVDLVDQSRIDGALAQLVAMRYLTEEKIQAPASALQLEFPPHVLTVTTGSGAVTVMKIGETAPTGTGVYIAFEDGIPRIVSRNPIETILSLLQAPPVLPVSLPEEGVPSP